MWLIDSSTFELHEFISAAVPPYAILSHTWGTTAEEVSFRDMRKSFETAKLKAGFAKIEGCCKMAVQHDLKWAWIDSCCIDKRSSAELTEAINSMFKWYERAQVCYVYLSDVRSRLDGEAFMKSKWFTRGVSASQLLA